MKKRIVILGAGESGVGASLLAQAKGYEVFVSDQSPIASKYREILLENEIEFEEGTHTESLIYNASLVIKSPGIPNKASIILGLNKRNIPVIAELEFASRYTKAKLIGITGTNGKTTTTLLLYHLLKEAGYKVGLSGNVGVSMAKQVIEDTFDYYVVEISSFQLDDMHDFHAHVSILLNITPDHLDRYDYSMEKYAASKLRIANNQTHEDYFIFFYDDPLIQKSVKTILRTTNGLAVSVEGSTAPGAYKKGESLFFDLSKANGENFNITLSDSPLTGEHNAINTMAAVTAASVLGIDERQIRSALKTFRNAPHRLEMVGEINKVTFINDSKATNVDAVYYALEGFKEPLIWIAGGIDKGNDYQQILELVKKNVKALVCLGKDNSLLKNFFYKVIPIEEEKLSMRSAVEKAYALAEEGDIVLLSPACSSFDLFQNYEDRGEQFRKAVKELENTFVNSATN